MTPTAALSALDRSLRATGQPVTLRRYAGTPPSQTTTDMALTGLYRVTGESLAAGGSLPVQHDATVVVSPTQLGSVVPRVGDKVVVASRERAVVEVRPFQMQGVIVRYELGLKG
jgi:hypothetical protein